MRSLNLEALGVTEEKLTEVILSELGLTKEQAVEALAEKFGVSLSRQAPIASGQKVVTDVGEATAKVLSESEIATLRDAASISARLFG